MALSQVVGCAALGPMKQPFYELLCTRRAPKNEALFATLRDLVTRMNASLPGAKRMCVRASRDTHPSACACTRLLPLLRLRTLTPSCL